MFKKSRKLLKLTTSNTNISVLNLYEQDDRNREIHSKHCQKEKHLHCECLFCDKTYQLAGIE